MALSFFDIRAKMCVVIEPFLLLPKFNVCNSIFSLKLNLTHGGNDDSRVRAPHHRREKYFHRSHTELCAAIVCCLHHLTRTFITLKIETSETCASPKHYEQLKHFSCLLFFENIQNVLMCKFFRASIDVRHWRFFSESEK